MKTSKILSLLLTAIFLFTATTVFAATKTWLAASGSWFSAQNWSPAGSPATGDTVVLDNGGTINIDQPLGFSGSFIWVRGTITSSSQGMALATNTVMEIHPGNYKILACTTGLSSTWRTLPAQQGL
ncbi:MAG: hypothetical protein FJ405_17485 [Verrucomicrobia bacterium]|nr:hypothetical protein [Verrucomicrobiota bacterium]